MRLLTNVCFDGLISGMLLKELEFIDDCMIVDIQELINGYMEVTSDDILVNVPYVEGCGLWFCAKKSNDVIPSTYRGACYTAASSARIIFEFYGGEERFPNFVEPLRVLEKVRSTLVAEEITENTKSWREIGKYMNGENELYSQTRQNRVPKMMKEIIMNYGFLDAPKILEYIEDHY